MLLSQVVPRRAAAQGAKGPRALGAAISSRHDRRTQSFLKLVSV
jgi:hypothetical protein